MFLRSYGHSTFALFCTMGIGVAGTACDSSNDKPVRDGGPVDMGKADGSADAPMIDGGTHTAMIDGGVDTGSIDTGLTGVEAFESLIEAKMRGAGIPGLAAAIVAGGAVKWQKGFGVADLASRRPITTDTPFPIASISKTFIATALMQLVEAGKIDLDASINQLGLPFVVRHPSFPDAEITLRMLTTHTSGIVDNWGVYDCHYYLEADGSRLLNLLSPGACPRTPVPNLAAFLEGYLTPTGDLFDASLNFTAAPTGGPGRRFSYSNVGASLAAYAMGTATQTPLEEQCEAHIFEPLGMSNTHWHLQDFADPSVVTSLHTVIEGELVTLPTYSMTTWPDGGLRTSVKDLARFLAAIMNGGTLGGTRILAQARVDEMLSPHTPAGMPLPAGNEVIDYQGIFWYGMMGLVGHSGGDPGVSTAMLFQPEAQLGVVLLMNAELADMETFIELVTRAIELGATL